MLREQTKRNDYTFIIFILLSLLAVIYFFTPIIHNKVNISTPIHELKLITQNTILQSFTTIFISILLEAIPFIIIGTFVSSIIQIFVSEEAITRIIPKNKFIGVLWAGLIGLIFPVCDCAIVPIVRRLIKKGVPLNIAVTFMLAVPIVNPIVLASTYYAFPNDPYVVFIRGGLGLICAMIVGILVGGTETNNRSKRSSTRYYSPRYYDNTHDIYFNNKRQKVEVECACGCGNINHHSKRNRGLLSTISDIIEHTSIELHDVGKFVILGSFLSALMQTFVPRNLILSIGQHNIYSVIVMIALAFLLAVCSETDAFIARTFVGQFTGGSIIAFLIFGPMIDIKNTLMLSGAFNFKFVLRLIFIIFVVCFAIGVFINYVALKGGFVW